MNYIIKFNTISDVKNYFELFNSRIEFAVASRLIGLNIVSRYKLCTESVFHSERYFSLVTITNYRDLIKYTDIKVNIIKELLGIRDKSIPVIMGILNITPDSFSDGNKYLSRTTALQHAEKLVKHGAGIIDIGGESTRPGAEKVGLGEELKRVVPVVKDILEQNEIVVSVDTYKAKVAEEATNSGALIINDISALRFDNDMIEVLKSNPQTKIVLMHMLGNPETMQNSPEYDNIVEDIISFFEERIEFCLLHGIVKDRIIVDPGIGFGKKQEDNTNLLRYLSILHSFGCEVLLGASRKSFINKIYPSTPTARVPGTLVTTSLAYDNSIQYIRVHDVSDNMQYLKVYASINKG